MKQLFILIALAMTLGAYAQTSSSAPAQSSKEKEKAEKKAERDEKREERHAKYIKYIDSLVMLGKFNFTPENFQLQPAGMTHTLHNPSFGVDFYPTYINVVLPIFVGITPPYGMGVMNFSTRERPGYMAVQTSDGWEITFDASRYVDNAKEFKLTIYSVSGQATLYITDQYDTSTMYSGYIKEI